MKILLLCLISLLCRSGATGNLRSTVQQSPDNRQLLTQPTVRLLTPSEKTTFRVGMRLSLSATATNAAGNRLADTAFSWTLRLFNGAANTYYSSLISEQVGNNIIAPPAPEPPPPILDSVYGSYLELILTVTDPDSGLQTVLKRVIQPKKVKMDFGIVPAGLFIIIDGIKFFPPMQLTGWHRQRFIVEAPNQGIYKFDDWSTEQLEAHTLLVTPRRNNTNVAIFVVNTGSPAAPTAQQPSPAVAPPAATPNPSPTHQTPSGPKTPLPTAELDIVGAPVESTPGPTPAPQPLSPVQTPTHPKPSSPIAMDPRTPSDPKLTAPTASPISAFNPPRPSMGPQTPTAPVITTPAPFHISAPTSPHFSGPLILGPPASKIHSNWSRPQTPAPYTPPMPPMTSPPSHGGSKEVPTAPTKTPTSAKGNSKSSRPIRIPTKPPSLAMQTPPISASVPLPASLTIASPTLDTEINPSPNKKPTLSGSSKRRKPN